MAKQTVFRRNLVCALAPFLALLSFGASGQSNVSSAHRTTYILPDGRILPEQKMDSLSNAWGKGRIAMVHSTQDDEKGIVHLVRVTDKMAKKREEESAKTEKALKEMIGKHAPDFTLKDLNGKKWRLSSLRGKVVVLNFWFTSCAPCIQEMPTLNDLVEKYEPEGVVFLALTFNDVKDVKDFLKEHKFEYTLLPESMEVNEKYKVSEFPVSFVIDRNGVFAASVAPDPDIKSTLTKSIESLL